MTAGHGASEVPWRNPCHLGGEINTATPTTGSPASLVAGTAWGQGAIPRRHMRRNHLDSCVLVVEQA